MGKKAAAIVVMALLAIAGCTSNKTQLPPNCNQMINVKQRTQCMYNESVSLLNPAKCKDIPDINLSIKCVDEIAMRMGKEYYCYQQTRLSAREECEKKVARLKAAQNKT